MTDTSPHGDPSNARRAVLGMGAGGLVVLAASACGSESSSPTSAGAGASSGSSAGGTRVRKDQVPEGGGVILSAEKVVVTQPTAGQFKAFSAICTHQGCPVDSVAKTIGCSCHGSQFAIADGAVVQGPATQPLPAKTATVDGDFVTVT